MLYPKPIIIAVCCAIAIVVGVYLFGQYTQAQNGSDDIPITSTAKHKPGPTAKGHWHGNVWHDETHTVTTHAVEQSLVETQPVPDEPLTHDEGFMTIEEYEKQINDEFDAIERNEWGLAIYGFPKPPVGIKFRTIEEDERASEIWSELLEKEVKNTLEAHERIKAHHRQQTKN